jgi:hypothetical protein
MGEVERAMWAVARMPQANVEMIVRALYEAVEKYNQTSDPAHLVKLAADATATVRLYQEVLFEKALLGDARDAVEVGEVLTRLRASN